LLTTEENISNQQVSTLQKANLFIVTETDVDGSLGHVFLLQQQLN